MSDLVNMTIRAYAAHRRAAGLPGGSKRAVEIALARGRITRNERGKIDQARADAEWLAHTKVHYRPLQAPAQAGIADGLNRLAAAVERIAQAVEGPAAIAGARPAARRPGPDLQAALRQANGGGSR